MAYKTIYDSRRWVLTSSADATVLLPPIAGGTGADLSATGGANQVLKQSTVGGNVTVGALGSGDVPDGALTSNVALLNRDPQTFTGKAGIAATASTSTLTLGGSTTIPALGANGAQLAALYGGANYGLLMGAIISGNGYIQVQRVDGTATAFNLLLQPNGGFVGVGTTAPKSALHVVGLPIYANNAAAVAGGLTAGAFYRTGADPDPVCVVH